MSDQNTTEPKTPMPYLWLLFEHMSQEHDLTLLDSELHGICRIVESMNPTPTGIEAEVCRDITARQQIGIAKYGTTLAGNPAPLSERIQHAYEEQLDGCNYLKWAHSEAVRLEAENAELREQIDHIKAIIADPNAVRLNLLRGTIAWTPETLRSVLGDPQP